MRHHHYISQCYLKGFTRGGTKKSKLTVVDLREKKCFETTPRNVGGKRDFNRIDFDGIDPNTLEKSLSKFEGEADSALQTLEENSDFEGETKSVILNLVALFAVRNPAMREHWKQFQAELAERTIDIILSTKERWESHIRQMKESGKEIDESVTYEDAKKFHDSKKYTITVAREHHIQTEFDSIDTILPLLAGRNWLLIRATEESGPFITTDKPVILTWKEPDKIPSFYRNSPGYGMNDTQVYFPVSKNVALVGEFDGHEIVFEGKRELVAALNTKMLMYTSKQVYAPNLAFFFRGENDELLDGTQLLKHIGGKR